MQKIEDGEDDGSFMAHAIVQNHNIGTWMKPIIRIIIIIIVIGVRG